MPYVVGAPAVAARLFGLVDNDMGKGTVREEWQQVHIGGQSVQYVGLVQLRVVSHSNLICPCMCARPGMVLRLRSLLHGASRLNLAPRSRAPSRELVTSLVLAVHTS